MKILNGASRNATLIQCAYGNVSRAHLYDTLSSVEVNDVVELCEFSSTLRVDSVRLVTENLGAGTKLKLGYKYSSGDKLGQEVEDAFGTFDTSSALNQLANFPPVELTGGDVIITAKIEGATASGKLDAYVDYVFKG